MLWTMCNDIVRVVTVWIFGLFVKIATNRLDWFYSLRVVWGCASGLFSRTNFDPWNTFFWAFITILRDHQRCSQAKKVGHAIHIAQQTFWKTRPKRLKKVWKRENSRLPAPYRQAWNRRSTSPHLWPNCLAAPPPRYKTPPRGRTTWISTTPTFTTPSHY